MIDYLAIGLTHLLMAYVAIRLLVRDDLDDEKAFDMPEPEPLFKKRKRRKPEIGVGPIESSNADAGSADA